MADVVPIPWRFLGAQGARVWRWETDHFVVTIIGEAHSFQWEVGDLVESLDGLPVPLMDGRTTDLGEAQRAAREVVGKSYSPTLGYAKYVGRLATTFKIATDEEIDFAQFHGTRIVVNVGLGGGEVMTLSGQASVEHYELRVVKDNGEVMKVQPHRIRSIVYERGGYDQMKNNQTLVGRMVHGTVNKQCTGTPGFIENTVEHNGEKCPVHEYGTLFD